MSTMNTRLRDARVKAGFLSARSAAIRHGWNVSTYAAHENGQNGFSAETALGYAQAFGASASWILLGKSSEHASQVIDAIPLIGSLNSGNWIDVESDWRHQGLMAAVSVHLPIDAVAFSIKSLSMWPRFRLGDLLVARRYFGLITEKIEDDEEIVAQLEDNRFTIANAFNSEKDRAIYDLHSHNYPVIRGAEIKSAYEIYFILPRKRWKEVRTADILTIDLQRATIAEIRKAVVDAELHPGV